MRSSYIKISRGKLGSSYTFAVSKWDRQGVQLDSEPSSMPIRDCGRLAGVLEAGFWSRSRVTPGTQTITKINYQSAQEHRSPSAYLAPHREVQSKCKRMQLNYYQVKKTHIGQLNRRKPILATYQHGDKRIGLAICNNLYKILRKITTKLFTFLELLTAWASPKGTGHDQSVHSRQFHCKLDVSDLVP